MKKGRNTLMKDYQMPEIEIEKFEIGQIMESNPFGDEVTMPVIDF